MSKKRVLNIKAQEIVTDGQRSVRYRGSDGKMHDLATADGENSECASSPTAQPFDIGNAYVIEYNGIENSVVKKYTNRVLGDSSVEELINALIGNFRLGHRGVYSDGKTGKPRKPQLAENQRLFFFNKLQMASFGKSLRYSDIAKIGYFLPISGNFKD